MTMTETKVSDEEIQGLIEAHSIAWAVEFQKGNKEESRFCSDTATALRQLQAENKALREDARRYRFMRSEELSGRVSRLLKFLAHEKSATLDVMDGIVDEAMADAALQQEKGDG